MRQDAGVSLSLLFNIKLSSYLVEIILLIATNPIIYTTKKYKLLIFTITYEIHMMVMLITLDIKISITGTTFTSIEFIIRSSKGWGRYLVAAVGSEARRILEKDQWRGEWVNWSLSTSWRSQACIPAEDCEGTWEVCIQEDETCTGPDESEACTRAGKLELEMKDWSLLCSKKESELRSRRCRSRPSRQWRPCRGS